MAVKTIQVEEYLCDVCGGHADGTWYEVTHLNGEVYAEMSCPIDLCKKHMKVFASQFSNHAFERYDEKGNTEELIRKMKHYDELHFYDCL